MDWQSINSAPKDGTEILATDYDAIEIVSWQTGITGEWINRDGEAFYAAWWQPLPDHPPFSAPVPVFPEDAQVIEPTERTLLVPVPVPVAVSERPWERDGWCDEQGRCWWFDPEDPNWVFDDATTCRHWSDFSLPHNALPLPGGEVEA